MVTAEDMKILWWVARCDFLNAEEIGGLDRRARRAHRLLAMTRGGYMKRWPGVGKPYLYSVSRRGAEMLGVPFVSKSPAPHSLMLARFKFSLHREMERRGLKLYSERSTGEIRKLGIKPEPDWFFVVEAPAYPAFFTEVHRWAGSVGRFYAEKVLGYIELFESGKLEEMNVNAAFVVTVADEWAKAEHLCRRAGQAGKYLGRFLFTSEERFSKDPLGPIWISPKGEERRCLLPPQIGEEGGHGDDGGR